MIRRERKPDVEDLIGAPYLLGGRSRLEGLDCLATSRIVLGRIFPDFGAGELPDSDDDIERAITGSAGLRWRFIGDNTAAANRVGDLIFGRRDVQAYVAVAIDRGGLCAITACGLHGVHTCPMRFLKDVAAIFRRDP
jgi:hypothetical protein